MNHVDGNRKNNKITNLEYVTQSRNIQHAYDTGLTSSTKPVNLYSQDFVYVDQYMSIASAARDMEVNASDIGEVCRNSTRRKYAGTFDDGTYCHWKFCEDDPDHPYVKVPLSQPMSAIPPQPNLTISVQPPFAPLTGPLFRLPDLPTFQMATSIFTDPLVHQVFNPAITPVSIPQGCHLPMYGTTFPQPIMIQS